MDEKETKECVEQVAQAVDEYLKEEEHKNAQKTLGAIGLILPWFLACLFIVFLAYSIVNFVKYTQETKELATKQDIIAVIENPGTAWEEWGELWGISGMTWEKLEEPFNAVQTDWETRGFSVDWQFMTNVYNGFTLKNVTFSEYSAWFKKRVNDVYINNRIADPNTNLTLGIAIVLLILGGCGTTFLVLRTIKKGTFVFMFL